MPNPIFKHYFSKFIFAGVWMLFTGIQTLILYNLAGQSWSVAIVDALVFNTLFAFLIIPLWYVIKYANPKRKTFFSLTITACVFLSIWLWGGFILLKILFFHNLSYQSLLQASIPWRLLQGMFCYTFIMLIYYLSIYAEKVRLQAENEIQLHKILKDSELNALKSQINPHFLFNSLNSIHSLMLTTPEKAQEMLIALSEFLRYTASGTGKPFVSLREEMENTERYLSIEKVRFGDKLNYHFHYAPNCLSMEVPAMILQPLFENAIKHGVYEGTGHVYIETHIKQKEHYLYICIKNDFDEKNTSPNRNGIGLANIRSRLNLLYQDQAFLHTDIQKGKFCVMLQIPLIKI